MSNYRIYKDNEVVFQVSSEGVLGKQVRVDDKTVEYIPVTQEDLTKTWNDIVSRMVNKARQDEQDRILSNIKSALFHH
jgi:L-rhamnose mutarotase